MKKLFLTMMVILMGFCSAWAVPAQGNRLKVKQPDGSVLTIRLVGDEYMHYVVTGDGFSVVRTDRGYCYARLDADKQLVATDLVAHEASERTTQEKAYLQTVGRYLAPALKPQAEQEKARVAQDRRKALAEKRAPQYDYSKFRGLVILVEYNDQTFDREDYKDVITETITKEGFDGYTDYAGKWVACTGSVRDYFTDNSMGVFKPEFDIVGPIKVNRSKYYAEGSDNAAQLTCDVINAADSEVDFSKYDGDKDGVVDMVFFIFAGHGAQVGGNDERLLWPHASQIYNPNATSYYNWQVRKDGVALGRYACSTELSGSDGSTAGYPTSRNIDGIGTICHEFSHVLGLPDFYDVDYEGSGGESKHPGQWSIMASGCYNGNARTPAGYTLYDRYAVGFATPELINGEGSYTLEPLNISNKGYRLNSPNSREYFLLENRQRTRWDAALPYHGMLVFRVDSTNTNVWQQNAVNNNPSHNYFELVRARGTGVAATQDPYPGARKVTSLTNTTSPANLKTWNGKDNQWGLTNITENVGTGTVSFTIESQLELNTLTLPEALRMLVGITSQIDYVAEPGSAEFVLTWSSSDENVATVDQDGVVTTLAAGETTITVESDNGLKAQCILTVFEAPMVDNIAAFKALDDGESVLLKLQNARVLATYRNDIYVRDATGAIVFSNTGLTMQKNAVVNGSVFGTKTTENRMPKFAGEADLTNAAGLVVEDGDEVEPIEVKLTDLNADYYAEKIVLRTIALDRRMMEGVSTSAQVVAYEGDLFYRIYNTLGVTGIRTPSATKMAQERYDVTGIFGTHKISTDFIIDEIYWLASPVSVEWEDTGIEMIDTKAADGNAVYDLQGRRVMSGVNDAADMNGSQLRGLSSPKLPKGIYIVGGRKVVVK